MVLHDSSLTGTLMRHIYATNRYQDNICTALSITIGILQFISTDIFQRTCPATPNPQDRPKMTAARSTQSPFTYYQLTPYQASAHIYIYNRTASRLWLPQQRPASQRAGGTTIFKTQESPGICIYPTPPRGGG